MVAPVGGVGINWTCDTPRLLDNAFSDGDAHDAKPIEALEGNAPNRSKLPGSLREHFPEAKPEEFTGGRSTPDRSKLFGSHGQRPWI